MNVPVSNNSSNTSGGAHSAHSAHGAHSAHSAQPVKVLVVDDEANIADLIKARLEFQDFEVRTAADGATAREIAKTFRPDAFILDVM
ncbi:MAG: response regulator, partial [Corynebacterium sp.]|nr:response regulator [Corynebacterium sp.]